MDSVIVEAEAADKVILLPLLLGDNTIRQMDSRVQAFDGYMTP